MKAFIQSPKIVKGIAIIAFFVSMDLGMSTTAIFEDFLDSIFISLPFIWLALVIVLTFFLSVFILLKIYLKYNLLIATESKDIQTILKEFFIFIGLGLLTGFISKFAFQSFFLIIFWLSSKI